MIYTTKYITIENTASMLCKYLALGTIEKLYRREELPDVTFKLSYYYIITMIKSWEIWKIEGQVFIIIKGDIPDHKP